MYPNTKLIGVCGAYLFNQQPIQLIQHLHKEGSKYGYRIAALTCSTDIMENTPDTKADLELIHLINHIPLTGMIILTETLKNPLLQEQILLICHRKKIPVFSIDGVLDGCYNMEFDNYHGFEQAVRHVVEVHGCRKVNLIAGFQDNRISDERIAAYKNVLADHNIPIEEERIGYGDFWERPTRQVIHNFLESSLPFPEAIVCANDTMAMVACSELGKFGYSVPEDIIVTGFDGIFSGQSHFPVLTTYEPDYADAVTFIIKELEHFIESGTFSLCHHPISYVEQINQSCGCMPKTIHNLNHIISTLYDNSNDTNWHNIAMNQLITANLYNDTIHELAELIPQHIRSWKGPFRFACVKASMLNHCTIEDHFQNMVSILNLRSGDSLETGTVYPIRKLIPNIHSIGDVDILIVTPLHSGETLYGFSVEGFHEINEQIMQRCNNFSFFLSYCLNMIVHNAQQRTLMHNLMEANQEISAMAYHDSMTRLYNRQGFYKELQSRLNANDVKEHYLYIFSIDMNRLKHINDTYGHAEGDFAIATLAHAIMNTVDEQALCARFGGDEFVVAILSPDKDAYSEIDFFTKLQEQINQTDCVSEKPYPIQASVGMCCLPLTPSINPEEMIALADEQMYHMKQHIKQFGTPS